MLQQFVINAQTCKVFLPIARSFPHSTTLGHACNLTHQSSEILISTSAIGSCSASMSASLPDRSLEQIVLTSTT
jgi:hypothetical protein